MREITSNNVHLLKDFDDCFSGIILCFKYDIFVGQIVYVNTSWEYLIITNADADGVYWEDDLDILVNNLIEDRVITSVKLINYNEKLNLN